MQWKYFKSSVASTFFLHLFSIYANTFDWDIHEKHELCLNGGTCFGADGICQAWEIRQNISFQSEL